MKHAEQFLKKIGLSKDIIEKLNSEEDVNLDELTSSFKSTLKEVFSNDPDFIQPIKDEVRGTELSKIEHRIKKTFGLSSEDVKDKKFDEIISTAFEKAKSTSAEGATELQNKLIELTKENKRLIEEVIPSKEAEATNTIKTFKKDSALRNVLSKKSLIVSPEVVLPAVQSFLSSQYEIDVTDSGELEVKTKNGLKPLNSDGTKALTFEELLDNHLTSLNVIKQSNGGTPGTGTPKPAPTNAGTGSPTASEAKFNLPGLQKAQANIEQLQSMKTFGKD
jgi:hypothetical protein